MKRLATILAIVLTLTLSVSCSQSKEAYFTSTYKVTQINGEDIVGENKAYADYPGVYFTQSDVQGEEQIQVGDYVQVYFYDMAKQDFAYVTKYKRP